MFEKQLLAYSLALVDSECLIMGHQLAKNKNKNKNLTVHNKFSMLRFTKL